MNNHLPFSEWILSEETLPTNCARELRAHIEQCSQCRSLFDGWEAARGMIRRAGLEAPRPGFVRRWKYLAEQRSQRPDARQALVFLTASGLGALALAASLAAQTASGGFSLAGTFTRSVSAVAGSFSEVLETAKVLEMVSSAVTSLASPAFWLAGIFVLCALCAAWLILLFRISKNGVK
jgi:anti-sigma factor RsiW